MALDLRLALGYYEHPKSKRLEARCPGAVDAFVRLWAWAGVSRPDGDLSGMSDEDIDLAPSRPCPGMAQALADVGYLDGPAGARTIHDWREHQPMVSGAIRERKSAAGRAAATARWGRRAGDATGCDHMRADATGCDTMRRVAGDAPSPSPSPSPSPQEQILSSPSGTHPSSAAEPAVAGARAVEVDAAPTTQESSQGEIRRPSEPPRCATCSIGREEGGLNQCLGAAWATRRRHCAGVVTTGGPACLTLRRAAAQHSGTLRAILDEAREASTAAAHDQHLVDELDRQAADAAQGVGGVDHADPAELPPGPPRDVIEGWNAVAGPKGWTTARLSRANGGKAMAALRRVGFRADWDALLAALRAKGWPWELGRPGPHQGWVPCLKWILKPENLADVLDKLACRPAATAGETPAVKTAAQMLVELKAKQAARRAAAAATDTTGGAA